MSHSVDTPLSRSRGGAWILVALAFVVPIAWPAVRKLRIDHSPTRELPASAPQIAELRALQARFPAGESILVGWDNANLQDLRIPLLQRRLLGAVSEDGIRRGGSAYVESVATPHEQLKQMTDRGLAADVAVTNLTGSLIGRGALHITLTEEGRASRDQTVQQITQAVAKQTGLTLRVAPRTIAFFPEEGDALFEGLAIDLPKEIAAATDLSDAHDLELTWDRFHSSDNQQAVQKIVLGSVGFATAAFPDGVPLVKAAELHAGLPVALEVRLSSAGRIDRRVALAEIRRLAVESRVPSEQLLLTGDLVEAAGLDQSFVAAAASPYGNASLQAILALGAILGVLTIGLRSPVRAGLILGLTAGTGLVVLGGFALAGIPVTLLTASAVVIGSLSSLALLTGLVAPTSIPGSLTRAARIASVMTIVAGAAMSAVPSIALRTVGISIALFSLMTLAIAESPILGWLRRGIAAPSSQHDSDWGLLLTRRGRWIGAAGLLALLIACSGLTQLNLDQETAGPLRAASGFAAQSRKANDTLAGTSALEAIVRFEPSAQSRMRFADRLELVRSIEADVRQVSGVTGAISLASFQPSKTSPAIDASPRERVAFNRYSKSLEEEFRKGTDSSKSLLSFGVAATSGSASAGTPELWKVRLSVDTAADLNVVMGDLAARIPRHTRIEPGVDHVVVGGPLVHATASTATRQSLLIMLAASLAMATAVSSLLLADLFAGLAIVLPSFLAQAAVVGVGAWFGRSIDPVEAATALGLALLGTSTALMIVAAARQRILAGQEAKAALADALSESTSSIAVAAVAVAATAMGGVLTSFLETTAYLLAAGLAISLLSTLLIVPTLVVGRLVRASASLSENSGNGDSAITQAVHPLRRSA